MELKVINNKGVENGSVQFDEKLLETKASKAVLHEAVLSYQGAQREGTHQTKTRSQVSGGGVKPWKQKGTGRARSGSTRSPLWRHGGIIFGPNPRDYSVTINKKKKQLAFRMAVKGLLDDNRIQMVEPIELSEIKTKHVAAVYAKWQAPTDSLFVLDKIDSKFNQASRNIANVRVVDVASLNIYDCLRARRVYVTKPALEALTTPDLKIHGETIMSEAFKILRRPIVTEKSTLMKNDNRYVIEVDPSASKHQIRQAVEERFKVNVLGVHTVRVLGKYRRKVGPIGGYKPNWKKAIVKIKSGQQIAWEEVA